MSADTASGLVRLADVEPEELQWLWPGRIPLGKLTMLAGDPGLGKSLLTVAMAAHVSTGRPWPIGGAPCERGSVLLLSAEDDLGDTIRPRLDAAGADVSKVYALPMLTEIDADGRPFKRMPNLAADVERIDAILARLADCRLLAIDPVSAYLGGVDSHKNSDLRAVLGPWAELAARRRVAVVCVSHLNKSNGAAMYRTAGSIAFVAAARSAHAVTKDKDEPARRLIVPVKMNLAADDQGALAYRVVGDGAPRLEWEPHPVQISADQALAPAEDDGHRTATDEAAEFLRDVLADGPVKAADVQREARQAGISDKALRRARERLGIKPRKRDFSGGWVWELPHEDAQDAQDAHVQERASSMDEGIFVTQDAQDAHVQERGRDEALTPDLFAGEEVVL